MLVQFKIIYPFGRPPANMQVMWRAHCYRYSVVIDSEADIFGTSDPELQLRWYEIKKHTFKGVRLYEGDRFILLSATKRWACPTEREAILSLIGRRRRQINILKNQIARARRELSLAERGLSVMDETA